MAFQLSLSPSSHYLTPHGKYNLSLINRRTYTLPFLHGSPKRILKSTRCALLKQEGDIQPTSVVAKNSCLKREISWVDYLREAVMPYVRLARIDNMFSIWLHGAPYFWSIALATPQGKIPDIGLLGKFVIPIVLTTCIICTINDIIDIDLDRKVERSQGRPLASGDLSLLQGILFLAIQILLVLGYGLLVPLNNLSRLLMAISFPLHIAYPLMKRITYWPQAYLGLTYNWGALVGWAAVKGSLDPSVVLPLYIGSALWTLVYDTIYAHQDIKDDLKVGIKSTAVLFGDSTKIWISLFAVACIVCLAISGVNSYIGWPFYAFLVAASAHFSWEISTVDLSIPDDCLQKFLSAKWIAAAVLSGILFGKLGTFS